MNAAKMKMMGGIEGHQKQVHGQAHSAVGQAARNQLTNREAELMRQYEAMKA